MKTKVFALALACSILLGMTACGGGNDAPAGEATNGEGAGDSQATETTADGDKTVVHFYTSSDVEYELDSQIASFAEARPDIVIEKHVIPEDDYDDKIRVLATGGSDTVDIFWCRGVSHVQQFIDVGYIEPYNTYAEASGVDLEPIATHLEYVSDPDGNFYGYPTYGNAWMLAYNKDLFDEAGVDYPTEGMTFDEYIELAASLTHTDGDTTYWGGMFPIWNLTVGAVAGGHYLLDEDLSYHRAYIETLKRMYDNGSVPVGEMQGGAWDNNAYFAAGNIYMNIIGDWMYRERDNIDFNWATTTAPIMPGTEPYHTMGDAHYLLVSASCENKQAAYDFVEYYCTSEDGTANIAAGAMVPVYPSAKAEEVYKEIVTVEGVDVRFKLVPLSGATPEVEYSEVRNAFTDEMMLYLYGEVSLDEAFDNFIALREEILNL